jgi:hypothetical protein
MRSNINQVFTSKHIHSNRFKDIGQFEERNTHRKFSTLHFFIQSKKYCSPNTLKENHAKNLQTVKNNEDNSEQRNSEKIS